MQSVLKFKNAPDGFAKIVAASFVLHIVLLLCVLLFFKAESKKIFFSPVYTVNLVGAEALKARPQALRAPKEAEGPSTPPGEGAAKKETVKKTEGPAKGRTVKIKGRAKDEPIVEKALKKVSERVKKKEESELVAGRIEALKKKAEAGRTRPGIDEIKKELSAKALRPENPSTASAASSSGAVRADNLEIKYPAYFSAIRDRVQDEWKYPEELKKDRISVIVSIKIGKTGKLLQVWVEKSSGSSAFDESLMTAVNKAAPFPPLPADFEGDYLETGLRFCPSCE